MFDIGWSELLVIGVVALIAIGPKELPGVLRSVGNWMGKIRRMASEFQGQFHEAMREAEMADLKKQVDETANSIGNFDPLGSVRSEVDKMQEDINQAMTEPPPSQAAPGDTASADTVPPVPDAGAVAPETPAPETPTPKIPAPELATPGEPAAAPKTATGERT